jgi:hypothetical protein
MQWKPLQGDLSCQYVVGVRCSDAVFVSVIKGGCDRHHISTRWWETASKIYALTWLMTQKHFITHLFLVFAAVNSSKSKMAKHIFHTFSNSFMLKCLEFFNTLMLLDFNFLQLGISRFSSASYVLQHVDARLTYEYMYKNFIPQTNLSSARGVANPSLTDIHTR